MLSRPSYPEGLFLPAEQSCNIFWHYFLGTKGMVIYENTPVPMAAICLKKARQD
jgi:hypothetical protein